MKLLDKKFLVVNKEILIRKATKKDLMIDSILHNCLRENLQPVEKGQAFMNLLEATVNIKDVDVACNIINRVKNWKRRGKITAPSSKNYFIDEDIIKKVDGFLNMLGFSHNNAIMYLMILRLPQEIKDKIVLSTANTQFNPKEYIGVRQGYQIARINKKDVEFQRYLFNKVRQMGLGIVYLRKMVDDFIDSKLSGKEYLTYWAKKKKVKDYSCAALTRNCFRFASTLRSFRTINLIGLASDLSKKQLVMGLHDLRNSTVDLKKALDERVSDTLDLIEDSKKEREDVLARSFTVNISEVKDKKHSCRIHLPFKIVRQLNIKKGDKIHLKIISIERLDSKKKKALLD